MHPRSRTTDSGGASATRILTVLAVLLASVVPAAMAATPFVHETVDAVGNVGQYSSLALDVQGNPHICHYDVTNADLKYTRKSGGVWIQETVDVTGSVGQSLSLSLDAQGNPRISYYDATNGNLKYASKSGAVWTLETVDATGDVGQGARHQSEIALEGPVLLGFLTAIYAVR